MTQALKWMKKVPALADQALRAHFAGNELYRHTAEIVAEGFNEVCVKVDDRWQPAQQVLIAFLPTLIALEHLPRVTEVRDAALRMQLPAAQRLLRCSHADGHKNHLAATAHSHVNSIIERDGKMLTLGERRALARQPSRVLLGKLLRDPHPMVAKILLRNPRITEHDVISMCSRRPAIISVIYEIAESWPHHGRVRMALVYNPGAPTAVTTPLLPLLTRTELVAVTRAMNVPTVLRVTASELLALRPPTGQPDPPSLIH